MRFSIQAALASSLAVLALADPGISPASVSKDADPESSFVVEKIVSSPQIPPKPDVVIMVDVTSSMTGAIGNIKNNLLQIIEAVGNAQAEAKFAVVGFGDLRDPNGFKVQQDLTDNDSDLQAAVNRLKAEFGIDGLSDWIYALHKVALTSISFRSDSSRIIVLVGDAPSHDPIQGVTLGSAISALNAGPMGEKIKVIAVNVQDLDRDRQATAVTAATGGVIIGSAPNEVTNAIISGLTNLDVTIKPEVISCEAGLVLTFEPASTRVSSGATVTFAEKAAVASDAAQNESLECEVQFLLNGNPGGDAYIQRMNVTVNQMGCFTCDPRPGKNLCHVTTSCTPTPFGTMCLTRPGYKADGVDDNDVKSQWRLNWPVSGHEHRVAVKPGKSSNTLCKPENKGSNVCKEVKIAKCLAKKSDDANLDSAQQVMVEGEL